MDPNNTNPSNTPPTEDTAPVQPPVPEETPATPVENEVPAAPAETTDTPADAPAPVDTATSVEPAAPAAAETPAFGTQPAAPEAAPASVFSATTGSAPQAPKQKDTKKLILIAAIAGGVVLLAVIAFVLYSLFMTVSKEDYRDAARQFNQVSSASSALTSDARTLGYSASSASDDSFEESVAEAEESVATLKTENEELSKLKAVRVGEGGKLYNAFNDKLEAYTAYASELVTSVKNLRPALAVCNNVSDAEDATARVAALKECSTALSEVKDVPNAQFKTYVDAISKAYGDYATVYEQIAALSNPYGSDYEQYKTLRDQMYEVQDTISEASDTFSESLKARDDELSVKDSADALADYLTDQQK